LFIKKLNGYFNDGGELWIIDYQLSIVQREGIYLKPLA